MTDSVTHYILKTSDWFEEMSYPNRSSNIERVRKKNIYLSSNAEQV